VISGGSDDDNNSSDFDYDGENMVPVVESRAVVRAD
jgi:hypothetical protein